ncbi:MAG: hypothetical protein ABFS28_14695 [Bacteroidota bacterium]
MKTKKRFDTLLSGLIPGIILPLTALVVIWAIQSEDGLLEFLKKFQYQNILSKLISLAAIPNLLLFFLFIWTDRTFSARGVIFATLVLAFVMLVLKFA